jgi:hypothetical protein
VRYAGERSIPQLTLTSRAPVTRSKTVFRIRIYLIRIRIQIRLNTDPDPDPIRIQGFKDQKLKIYTRFFWIKNYNLPIPRNPEMTSKLQKKPSAFKIEHPALQNMKFLNFLQLLRVILSFCLPGSGSGFRLRIRIH